MTQLPLFFVDNESDLMPSILYQLSIILIDAKPEHVAKIATGHPINADGAVQIVSGILMNRVPIMIVKLGVYFAHRLEGNAHVVQVRDKYHKLMMTFKIQEI